MRIRLVLALALTAQLGCGANHTPCPAAGQVTTAAPTTASTTSRPPPTSASSSCEVRAFPGNADDTDAVSKVLRSAENAISKYFHRGAVEACFKDVQCVVEIMPVESCVAKAGLLTTLTSYTTDTKGVTALFMFAPSKQPEMIQSAAGAVPKPDYFEKQMIHELGGIVFDHETRLKSSGWRFFSAPAWFYQGLEEFVALRGMTNRDVADRYWSLYLKQAATHLGAVTTNPDTAVVNAYSDGASLVGYIWHEAGGAKGLACVLRSPAQSFADALPACGFNGWNGFAAWLAATPKMPN